MSVVTFLTPPLFHSTFVTIVTYWLAVHCYLRGLAEVAFSFPDFRTEFLIVTSVENGKKLSPRSHFHIRE